MLVVVSRVITVAAVVVVVGLLPLLSDRDPAQSILRARSAERDITPQALDAIRDDLGLQGGPVSTFGHWLGGVLSGDPGRSWISGEPVLSPAVSALGVSLTLMACALVVAVVVAALLVVPTVRDGLAGRPRRGSGASAVALTSVPEFLWAAMLLVVGAVWLSLPAYGWNGPTQALLPALALGLPAGGLLGRLLSDAVATTFTEHWVTTWSVAGFSSGAIIRAVLRRAVAGLMPQIGLVMVGLTAGAVAVEEVFAIPGLGRQLLDDARAQDLPALQIGIVLLLGVSVVLGVMAEVVRRGLLGRARRLGSLPMAQNVFATAGAARAVPAVAVGLLAVVVAGGMARDPLATSRARLAAPSWSHPFGTDAVGRDVLARVAHGAWHSIGVGVVVLVAALVIGLVVGMLAHLGRGPIEVFNALPPVLVGLVVAGVAGPSTSGAAVAVVIASWAPLAAHTAALIDEQRSMPYVRVLPALGAGRVRIMWETVLPAVLPAVVRHAALRLPGVVLALAALGFLGLGSAPPQPDWGLILADGIPVVERAPWVVLGPLVSLIALSVAATGLAGCQSVRRRRTTGSKASVSAE
ncbi:ABC transporter permease subunit [Williamsia sp. CHRR-6]|nr:ABC transporter permease subunit [Williamsia sp. CHRR-6]